MTSSILLPILLIVIAGVANGSFALTTKYMKNWQFENIWMPFAIICFLCLPWITMVALGANAVQVYSQTPNSLLTIIIAGGLFFGIGQFCLAKALSTIGLGLGFLINIGLGIVLGSLIPLFTQHSQHIYSLFGLLTVVSIALALWGLINYYIAGKMRDAQKGGDVQIQKSSFTVGLIFAVVAGFSSAGQNYVFSLSKPIQDHALALGMKALPASIIVWPLFLTAATIPYAIYMFMQLSKNKTWGNFAKPSSLLYLIFTVIMAVFWFGSLVLYSKASQLIGSLGPIIGWPLFMVLIIVTSSFWGWRHHEWDGCDKQTRSKMVKGILWLFVAIGLLSFTTTLV